ncbi:MAG: nitroreductase family protein [Patescibacteria group bacterium]
MLHNTIDQNKCQRCGTCVAICPNKVYKKDANGNIVVDPKRIHLCVQCGHCMAACPNKAVFVEGLSYDKDFFDLSKNNVAFQDFYNFISTRRAIRVFQPKAVSPELLQKVVSALETAPMSYPPNHKVQLTIINGREKIVRALPLLTTSYKQLVRYMRNPIIRQVIKHRAGKSNYNSLKGHVVELMTTKLPAMEQGQEDIFTRGAPAMILFHANKSADHYYEDGFISLTYGMLAVHALGLGGCVTSLVPGGINWVPGLRAMFKIPKQNEVVGALLIGYPAYRFKRGICRKIKNVQWV